MPRSSLLAIPALFLALAGSACSGSDVFEDGSGSGGGATGATTTSSASTDPSGSTSATTSTTGGTGGEGGAGQGGAGQGGFGVTVGPTTGTGGAGQGGADQGGAGPGGGQPACDLEGADVDDEGAFLTQDAGLLGYNGTSADLSTIVIVELWFQYGAQSEPHTFTFTGENYADCHTCAVLARDCGDGDCARRFLVESGTLEVDEVDLVDDRFRGTLRDVVAREVTFEGSVSTPVPGGEIWCAEELQLDAQSIEGLPFSLTK